jgi:small conductance mechanosensitive channel
MLNHIDIEQIKKIATELVMDYGLNILGAIVVFIVGRILCSVVRNVAIRVMEGAKVEKTAADFIGNLLFWAANLVVLIAALGQLGVETASFIAIFGAAGLAVGLALQGSLSNFASGVMIIIFRPFKVGDYISAGGEGGTVTEIQIFNTVLTTPDNKVIFVPNSQITGSSITNANANSTRRVDLVIGVSYDDDIDGVRSTISDVIKNDARILKDQEVTIAVGSLGDNSVNFFVRPWVKSEDYWGTLFDLNENIKKALDAKGFSIPYPQRDVHIYNEK